MTLSSTSGAAESAGAANKSEGKRAVCMPAAYRGCIDPQLDAAASSAASASVSDGLSGSGPKVQSSSSDGGSSHGPPGGAKSASAASAGSHSDDTIFMDDQNDAINAVGLCPGSSPAVPAPTYPPPGSGTSSSCPATSTSCTQEGARCYAPSTTLPLTSTTKDADVKPGGSPSKGAAAAAMPISFDTPDSSVVMSTASVAGGDHLSGSAPTGRAGYRDPSPESSKRAASRGT